MSTVITSGISQEEILILQALLSIDGLGTRVLWSLLQDAGSPPALWQASDDFLQARLPKQKLAAFRNRREAGLNTDALAACHNLGIQVLPYTHPQYPVLLKESHQPPPLLYVQGSLEALGGKTLAVVGTRSLSEYGRQVTEKLVQDLQPAGVNIISGLAAGIDTVAHGAALNNGLTTVAVFGCGLDIIFPRSNQRLSEAIVEGGGALVSEYPPGTPGNKYTYPQRNRIVAGMSHGVLVVEGDVRSGSLITARLALEEGRSVFAVPGNIFSPGSQGPLHLIRNGAVPVACGEDMLRELSWWLPEHQTAGQLGLELASVGQAKSQKPSVSSSSIEALDLSEAEKTLLQAVSYDPMPVDDLPRACGMTSAQVNEGLTLLELEGLLVLLPGAKVCRR